MNINHTSISKEMSRIVNALPYVRKVFKRTFLGLSMKRTQTFKYPSKKIRKQIQVLHKTVNGLDVIEFGDGTRNVVYLHGGAYFLKGNTQHYKFITEFCQMKNTKVIYIDYPVGCSYKETLSLTQEALNEIKYDAIMGDSAGGTLALSLKTDVPLFLFSPWVDLSMTNENIDDTNEFMFTKEELLQCATTFAGDLDLKDPIISPLYKPVTNRVTIFAGTNDILYHDIKLLEEKNPSVILHSYVGLPHVFMVLGITPEVRTVIKNIEV